MADSKTKKFRVKHHKPNNSDDEEMTTIPQADSTVANESTEPQQQQQISNTTNTTNTTSTKSTKAKKKKGKETQLSFADEDEGETVVISKVKARPDLQSLPKLSFRSKDTQKALPTAAFSQMHSSYSAQDIQNLRENTKTTVAAQTATVATKQHKPAKQEPLFTSPNDPEIPEFSHSGKIPTASEIRAAKEKRQKMRQKIERDKEDSEINAEMTAREKAHQQRFAPSAPPPESFISIHTENETTIECSNTTENHNSRLVREDDDDDVNEETFDDYSGKRISFAPQKTAKQAIREEIRELMLQQQETTKTETTEKTARKGNENSIADDGNENDFFSSKKKKKMKNGREEENLGSDEEWERAQLQKAGFRAVSSVVETRKMSAQPQTATQSLPACIRAFGEDSLAQIIPISESQTKIENKLAKMCDLNDLHKQQLAQVMNKIENVGDCLTTYDTDLADLNQKYQFYQKIRDHILDLLDCLDAKMPEVDSALENIRDVRQRRRRQQRRDLLLRIKDQYLELKPLLGGGKAPTVEKAPSKRNRNNNNNNENNNNNSSSDSDTKENENTSEEEQVGLNGNGRNDDSFGRDRGYAKRVQRRARMEKLKKRLEIRHTKRKQQNQQNSQSEQSFAGDGWSSESDDGSDGEYWSRAHENVLEKSKHMMDEVDEQFSTISPIKTVLEQWKKNHSQTYKDCYVSLCLPTLFSPYIHSELLCWNPFETPTVDHFVWYSALFNYGAQEDGQINEDDEDFDLVPRLMQYVVVPFLTQCVSDGFDPLSVQHTKSLVSLVSDLLNYVDATTPEFKALLLEVVTTIQRTIDTLPLYFPTNPLAVEANAFCNWLFVKSVKLLRNISQWNNILSGDLLRKMSMEKITGDKQVPYLKSIESVDKSLDAAKLILDSYPEAWINPPNNTVTPQLAKLHQFLKRTANKLEENKLNSQSQLQSQEGGSVVVTVEKIVRLFVQINDRETANAVCKQHGLKIGLL